jgi:predicted Zn-dependent protease with MMP-like domain
VESDQFHAIVLEAWEALPARFRERIHNVAIVVEPVGRTPVGFEHGIARGSILLGLYQGIPLNRRSEGYSGVLPDRITLFQEAIQQVAQGDDHLVRQVVEDVLLHEVAHYFGFSEAEVRAMEKTRAARLTQSARPR